GNLDWPSAFAAEQNREKEGLRRLRNIGDYLPYARRTWRRADRVLAAFQHTVDGLAAVPPERITMLPEVGYDEEIFFPPSWLDGAEGHRASEEDARGGPLTFLFAGRLVPYKLAEVAVRAFVGSPSLRNAHRLRVVGDGPERARLEQIISDHDAAGVVSIEGRRDQRGVAEAMRDSDVFVFPSIRELGAGVVVEAMACGLLSVVVDYGGPADLVAPERGRKVAMAPLEDLVLSFRSQMEACAAGAWTEDQLRTRRAAVSYAREHFPWHRKAKTTERIYRAVLGG
ncbi:MAG: glycosyltransferase family 4 protein, partial [Ornithinimicrobium sp.]